MRWTSEMEEMRRVSESSWSGPRGDLTGCGEFAEEREGPLRWGGGPVTS